MSYPESSKPSLKNGCRLDESGALLVPEGMIRFKGAGAAIVRHCDGQKTIAEIITTLQTEFGGADRAQIEKDVHDFLKKLSEKGVLKLL